MATGRINLLEDFTFQTTVLSGSSTNLNTCGPGLFYTSAQTQNNPTSHNYFVISLTYSSYVSQLAIRMSNADTYVRTAHTTGWTSWKKVTTS